MPIPIPHPRRNKYFARKVKLDGYTFDSQKEAKRYGELKLLAMTGEISALSVHPKYKFEINGVLVGTYTADFRYWKNTPHMLVEVVEDVKSEETAKLKTFKIKRELMKAIHGINVTIV